eukprot:symbB.v1.2.029577.t1/scaffold3252.1/size60189/3
MIVSFCGGKQDQIMLQKSFFGLVFGKELISSAGYWLLLLPCGLCQKQRHRLSQLRRCGCGKVSKVGDGCPTCQNTDGKELTFPRLSFAHLCGSSSSGLEIEVSDLGRQCLAWSLLQPVPKPIIEVGMAKVKWLESKSSLKAALLLKLLVEIAWVFGLWSSWILL